MYKDCLAFYIEGINNKVDGTIGFGVLERIELAYSILVGTYQPGDSIYIYGFSRGAASALSLAHYINDFGIVAMKNEYYKAMALPVWLNDKTSLGANFHDYFSKQLAISFAQGHKPCYGPSVNVTLIDTVFLTTECNPKEHLWLENVTGIAKSITHFISKHEERGSFRPTVLYVTDKVPATNTNYPKDIYGLIEFTAQQAYVPAPEIFNCLKQLHLDGSHSDIGGRYDNSMLGLPVLDHILKEFSIAKIPFCKKTAVAIRSKMTDTKIITERGLHWRFLSTLGQTVQLMAPDSHLALIANKFRAIGYNRNVDPNPVVLCDPTCGDLLFENARFFYVSYQAVKRLLSAMLDDNLTCNFDHFDVRHIEGGLSYFDDFEVPISSDGCFFYHRQPEKELESFRMLDASKKSKSYQNGNDIIANQIWVERFNAIVAQYNIEVQEYASQPDNPLASVYLYRGHFGLPVISGNRFAWTNLRVLTSIKEEFMITDSKKGLQLERWLCEYFKITINELNSLPDTFLATHPCP